MALATYLALSAENFDERIVDKVAGVGMIRGEYICRRARLSIQSPECRRLLRDYLQRTLSAFAGKPVWYRFIDMQSTEANLLAENDVHLVEEVPLLGIRGMRRAARFPDAFRVEFESLRPIWEAHPGFGLILPYVSELAEVQLALDTARAFGFRGPLACMLETPAACLQLDQFLDMGIRHFVIGMNDLKSLVTGAGRGSAFDRFDHPAMRSLLLDMRRKTRAAGATLFVAGYHKPGFIAALADYDFDGVIIHYSGFHRLIDPRTADYEDVGFMDAMKRMDRPVRLRQWALELYKRSFGTTEIDAAPSASEVTLLRPGS